MSSKMENDFVVSTPASKRILSIDIIRGFLLLVILVGHIELPPNFYDFFTGRGRLFVSAAEGFFFMSGLLIGMVYRRKLSWGMKAIFKKMWTRATELYIASVIMTLTYAFIVAKTSHFYIKDGLPNPLDWSHIIIQTLLLRFDYGWADFLARFAILMLIAPFVFYCIAKGRWKLVLVGIITAYIFRHQNFTLGWQLLFNGGMLIGFYWSEINNWWKRLGTDRRRLIKQFLVVTAAVTFIYSYATVYVLSELNNYLVHLPAWLKHLTLSWNRLTDQVWVYAQKWTLGPLRVALFFIWGSVAYFWVNQREQSINRNTRGVLLLIGQNSLFVYIFHSAVVFGLKFIIPAKTNPFENFIIVSFGLAILIGGTYGYRAFRARRPELNSSNLYSYFAKKSRSLLSSR